MSNVRVLITGANGFVGAHVLDAMLSSAAVLETGAEVHACSRHGQPKKAGIQWHQVDLLERTQSRALIYRVKPSHLLHLAWSVEHGAFWTSPDNLDWLAASSLLLRDFREAGGQRALATGTCAEYGASQDLCHEDVTPIEPKSLYAAAKHSLHLAGTHYAAVSGLSFAWARLFQVMGRGEPPTRLIPSLTRHLLDGKSFPMGSGKPLRDFVDVRDVAKSLTALLFTRLNGPVNVASGTGRSIGDVCRQVGQRVGQPDLIHAGALKDRVDEPVRIVADVSKLKDAIGSLPSRPLEDTLDDVARWLSAEQNDTPEGRSSI